MLNSHQPTTGNLIFRSSHQIKFQVGWRLKNVSSKSKLFLMESWESDIISNLVIESVGKTEIVIKMNWVTKEKNKTFLISVTMHQEN